jgi:hypothetical protein
MCYTYAMNKLSTGYRLLIVSGVVALFFIIWGISNYVETLPKTLIQSNSTPSSQVIPIGTSPSSTITPPAPASASASASDLDSNGCYPADKAISHEGENACVDLVVGYTYDSRGTKFIDQYSSYSNGFSVYIPHTSTASSMPLDQFDGKTIKVTGLIHNYRSGPQITVTDSSQIEIY